MGKYIFLLNRSLLFLTPSRFFLMVSSAVKRPTVFVSALSALRSIFRSSAYKPRLLVNCIWFLMSLGCCYSNFSPVVTPRSFLFCLTLQREQSNATNVSLSIQKDYFPFTFFYTFVVGFIMSLHMFLFNLSVVQTRILRSLV